MKGLKELENINVDKIAVEEYINANYDIYGKLTFENNNGLCIVNCDGNVEVKNEEIEKLTNGFVWGKVDGNFDCSHCKNLLFLKGAPEYVGGIFSCIHCENLKSLEGAPKNVKEINCDDKLKNNN